MTAVYYLDGVLDPTLRFYAGDVGPAFILMSSDVCPDRAVLVVDYLESDRISSMKWTAYSPDLNPYWKSFGYSRSCCGYTFLTPKHFHRAANFFTGGMTIMWLCVGWSPHRKHGHTMYTIAEYCWHTVWMSVLIVSFDLNMFFANKSNMTSSYNLWKFNNILPLYEIFVLFVA